MTEDKAPEGEHWWIVEDSKFTIHFVGSEERAKQIVQAMTEDGQSGFNARQWAERPADAPVQPARVEDVVDISTSEPLAAKPSPVKKTGGK